MIEQPEATPPPPDADDAPDGVSTANIDENVTFEQAQEELEAIVRTLERGETSLDRTLELWERGEELYALCAARLDAAEGRIEKLTRELEADDEQPADDSADDC